jgi:hypothetical protein
MLLLGSRTVAQIHELVAEAVPLAVEVVEEVDAVVFEAFRPLSEILLSLSILRKYLMLEVLLSKHQYRKEDVVNAVESLDTTSVHALLFIPKTMKLNKRPR